MIQAILLANMAPGDIPAIIFPHIMYKIMNKYKFNLFKLNRLLTKNILFSLNSRKFGST